jgi:hypothetical protein
LSTTENVKRIVAGALLTGGVALAGLAMSAGTAQAFNPQPGPPGLPVSAVQRAQS